MGMGSSLGHSMNWHSMAGSMVGRTSRLVRRYRSGCSHVGSLAGSRSLVRIGNQQCMRGIGSMSHEHRRLR